MIVTLFKYRNSQDGIAQIAKFNEKTMGRQIRQFNLRSECSRYTGIPDNVLDKLSKTY